jgi:hypothetical protein
MMVCKICSHSERAAIETAIVERRSLRDIAGQYGISRSAVDRHKAHIPKKLAKARQAEEVAESTSLLSRVEKLMARCENIYETAMQAGELTGAVGATRELRGCLELLGKLSGELQPNGSRVAINLGDVTKIDVRALSEGQIEALYARLSADLQGNVRGMSDAEIDSEISRALQASFPDHPETVRETILFDDVTLPPGPGIEANRRHDAAMAERCAAVGKSYLKRPWRNASPFDRYRMLQAAWLRETGEELSASFDSLGSRVVMEIDFDLSDDRDWMGWPKVRLKHTAVAVSEPVRPMIDGRH